MPNKTTIPEGSIIYEGNPYLPFGGVMTSGEIYSLYVSFNRQKLICAPLCPSPEVAEALLHYVSEESSGTVSLVLTKVKFTDIQIDSEKPTRCSIHTLADQLC